MTSTGTPARIVTPSAPSRRATAKVKNPLPVPTQCPYCGSAVKCVNNTEIYGRAYGEWPWAYLCSDSKCKAYVGLHPFTAIPLGTLADKATRDARTSAKKWFNDLWQDGDMTRSEAYARLAKAMNLHVEECHFGWFSIEQCKQAKALILDGKV